MFKQFKIISKRNGDNMLGCTHSLAIIIALFILTLNMVYDAL